MIKTHIKNNRTYLNFEKVLQSFGFFEPEQDIIEFFLIPANDEQRFKNLSNYPHSWKASNTILTGITAINQASQTPAIQQALEDQGSAQNVAHGISEFMKILKRNDIRNITTPTTTTIEVFHASSGSSSTSSTDSSSVQESEEATEQHQLDDKDIEIMLLKKKNALLMDFVMNSKDEHNAKWVELCLGLLMVV